MIQSENRSDKLKDLLGIAAVATLALLQWSAIRQQAQTRAAVERLAAAIDESATHARQMRLPPEVDRYAGAGRAFTVEDLRAIVREELQRVPREGEPATPHATRSAAAAPPAEPPPGNADAYAAARRLVEQAISARAWRQTDGAELAALRTKLTGEQVRSLAKQLLPAVNSQQVLVEDDATRFRSIPCRRVGLSSTAPLGMPVGLSATARWLTMPV